MTTHILNDYKTNNIGEQRPIESCCQFDASKLEFNPIFGEQVSLLLPCDEDILLHNTLNKKKFHKHKLPPNCLVLNFSCALKIKNDIDHLGRVKGRKKSDDMLPYPVNYLPCFF